ncbi:MAG: OB-fold domain-containing protein [Acidimicrobiaceae bacterium]|nr:OB-fold domain-containing protein [Acidimicrobiaceae bacterium]
MSSPAPASPEAATLPRAVGTDPYRFDDPTWLAAPATLAGRARPGQPKESAPFWEGLRNGRVLFQRCSACRRYTYYPAVACQWCGGEVAYEEVDGLATVNTFAPCYLEFGPGNVPPYVVAIVNPNCEPDLQVMTNLVNCRIADIRIGMPVQPRIVVDADYAMLLYEPS